MKRKEPSKQKRVKNAKLSLHGVPFKDALRAFLKTPPPKSSTATSEVSSDKAERHVPAREVERK